MINNQIGFYDFRYPRYPFNRTPYRYRKNGFRPVIHVNGDDPERVCFAIRRFGLPQKFHKDIVVDVVRYRKWGHNEGDDPTLTQTDDVQKVSQHPGARALYTEQLIAEGVVTPS